MNRAVAQVRFDEDAAPLLADLTTAGIDTRDFGRFVNRVVPGVIEPTYFDEEQAMPILLGWLPKLDNPRVKETVVRHLKTRSAKGAASGPLIAEFRQADDDLRWVIGDTLQAVATPEDYTDIVGLAADTTLGRGRQMLVDMLWRVKTPDAREAALACLSDPTVALHAGSALRRTIGNQEAISYLEPLTRHPDAKVVQAAQINLTRARKSIERRTATDSRRP